MRKLLFFCALLLSGCSSQQPDTAPRAATASFTPMPSAEPDAVRALTDSRMKQLGLTVIRFADRNKELFPDLSSAAAMQKAVQPYLKEEPVAGAEIFVQPLTGEAFEPNTSLSKTSWGGMETPNKIVMLYEASPSPNSTRGVLFCDGHHQRIGEDEWASLKAASGVR